MMRLFALCVALAGCSDPTLNAGVRIGAGGVSVTPSVSTRLDGGGTISYTP